MKDLLIGNTGLVIKNNDVVIGFSDHQHQEHLLVSHKGEVKHSLDTGVGIENYVNSDDKNEMLSEIATEFTKDGMEVRSVNYNEESKDLDFDAKYNS